MYLCVPVSLPLSTLMSQNIQQNWTLNNILKVLLLINSNSCSASCQHSLALFLLRQFLTFLRPLWLGQLLYNFSLSLSLSTSPFLFLSPSLSMSYLSAPSILRQPCSLACLWHPLKKKISYKKQDHGSHQERLGIQHRLWPICHLLLIVLHMWVTVYGGAAWWWNLMRLP